ncbi:MAG TPA: hypothetical protein VHD91_07885 [Gaiellaceae bacterium]|nr:hypothetical protein [Gaiellaceae bacterium]
MRKPTLADRLLAAAPLATVYLWLCVVYAVESVGHKAPWLFPDELKTTQIARSLATTGHPMQRVAHASIDSLYTVWTAPWWRIQDTLTAYAAIRYADVLLMTAVVFPAYFLARLFVRKPAALFVAAAAGAIPSLAYSAWIVEENLAYPYATLCLFLIGRALLARNSRRAWVLAVVASLLAPAMRRELVVVPAALVLAALLALWASDRERERRSRWSRSDRVGAYLLILGGAFFVMALIGAHSTEWNTSWVFLRHRIVNMTGWAAGSLAIGIGVIPAIGGLASLWRAPGEERSWNLTVFRSLAVAGIVAFGLYTGVKAAFLSDYFATRVEERNLIYVTPLLLVGTAIVLERRRVNLWALALGGGYVTYLVFYALYHPTQTPYEMGTGLYSDSLGLAILEQGQEYVHWTAQEVHWIMLAIGLGGIALLAAVGWRRLPRTAGVALAVAAGVAVVGWSLLGEMSAASGGNKISRAFADTVSPRDGQPLDWVDDLTHDQPTLYEGVGEVDQNGEQTLELLNRSLVRIGSLDGSIDGPGPSGAPNLAPDGHTYWDSHDPNAGPQYRYVVEDYPCVDFAGTLIATHWHRAGTGTALQRPWRLVELTQPNRLNALCTGLTADGWSGLDDSGYYRFSGPRGWLRVSVSLRAWGGPTPPTPVHILLGGLTVGPDLEAHLGTVSHTTSLRLAPTQTRVYWFPIHVSKFACRVIVKNKFVPADVQPGNPDRRTLGAQVSYRFYTKLPHGVKPSTG